MRFKPMLALLIGWLLISGAAAQVAPLTRAHAHNDYEHPRPLLDALSHGFCSVEADVFLIDGELIVAHNLPAKPDTLRSLKNLYLAPLKAHLLRNQGVVYPGFKGPFYLMIDIKAKGNAVFQVLKNQLQPYQEVFQPAGIQVFLSGDRPIEAVLADPEQVMSIDGRPSDLGKGFAPETMPVVSDNYHNHFKWRGEGEMPPAEKAYLTRLVETVHAEGKKLRLWASPDKPEVWEALYHAGADLINTDNLAGLQAFLAKKGKKD
jgi:hypothetical protein